MEIHISSRVITEVKHLELNQFSDGSTLQGSGKCFCRKVGNMGPLHLVHYKAIYVNIYIYIYIYDIVMKFK